MMSRRSKRFYLLDSRSQAARKTGMLSNDRVDQTAIDRATFVAEDVAELTQSG